MTRNITAIDELNYTIAPRANSSAVNAEIDIEMKVTKLNGSTQTVTRADVNFITTVWNSFMNDPDGRAYIEGNIIPDLVSKYAQVWAGLAAYADFL